MKVQVMLKKLKVLVMKKLKHMNTKLMRTHLSECMLLTLDMAILRYFYICLISVPTDMILMDMVLTHMVNPDTYMNLDTNRNLDMNMQQVTDMNMHLHTKTNLDMFMNLDTNRTLHTNTQQDTDMNMHLNTHMSLDTNRNLDTSKLMKLPTEQERCRIAALC